MKALLIAIFTLLSVVAIGQDGPQRTYVGSNRELNTRYGGYQVIRAFQPPLYYGVWTTEDSMGYVWFDTVTHALFYHDGTERVAITPTGITLTTTGTSGPATLVGSVLNVPDYSSGSAIAPGGWLDTSGGYMFFDTTNHLDTDLSSPSNSKVITSAGVNGALADYYLASNPDGFTTQSALDDTASDIRSVIPDVSGFALQSGLDDTAAALRLVIPDVSGLVSYTDTSGVIPSTYQLDTAKAAIRGEIPDVSGYATTTSLADSVSGRVKYSDTVSTIATQPWVISQGYSTTTGTVTTVSVVSANGLAGSVANPTTEPAITLTTTVNGLVKGNGTALSAATAGTDYVTPSYLMRTFTTTNFTTSVTMNTDSYNNYRITSQAGALLFNAPSGTPFHGQIMSVDINSNGTAHALTYNAIFKGTGDAPTALSATSTTTTTLVFRYNATGTGYWDFWSYKEVSH